MKASWSNQAPLPFLKSISFSVAYLFLQLLLPVHSLDRTQDPPLAVCRYCFGMVGSFQKELSIQMKMLCMLLPKLCAEFN